MNTVGSIVRKIIEFCTAHDGLKNVLILLLMFCSFQVYADKKYNKRFNKAIQSDTLEMAEQVLKDWELNGPHDGDYYAAHFNLHYNRGIKLIVMLSENLPVYAEQSMSIRDSSGNDAGYMYSGYVIKDSLQRDSAAMWLNQGVALFPQRLDLWAGLVRFYLQLDSVDSVMAVLDRLKVWKLQHVEQKWIWTSDSRIRKQSESIGEILQYYFLKFWNFDNYLLQAVHVADIGIALCPKNAVFYNDKAGVEYTKQNYEEALSIFEQALKLSPRDKLIKQNIEYIKSIIANQ